MSGLNAALERTGSSFVQKNGLPAQRQRNTDGDNAAVRALARGLTVLSLFDAEHRDWTLDEILERTGLPRMTGCRIARTLRDEGYLVMDRTTGSYALGPAMLAGVYLTENYEQLTASARPYLESLASETGETVTFAVEVRGAAVCADIVRAARPSRQEIAIGRMIDDTANAHGKVFAAFKPARERRRIIEAQHEPRTPSTITAPAGLAKELETVRRNELAFDLEEHDLGTCAVATPVRDQMGNVVASLAVVVPAGRFGARQRTACSEAVLASASRLSSYLGYAGARSKRAVST